MSPGGAIFFLPFHPKESLFLPSLQATFDACCHPWATLPDCQFQEGLRMVMIGQVAGFSRLLQTGGVRTRWVSTGLASLLGGERDQRRQSSQPTIGSHRVPVLHQVWDATCYAPTQKSHPETGQKVGGSGGPGWPECRPPSFSGSFPALPPGSWSEEGPRRAVVDWPWRCPPPQEQVTSWLIREQLKSSPWHRRRGDENGLEKVFWKDVKARALARQPSSSWLYWHRRPWGWRP